MPTKHIPTVALRRSNTDVNKVADTGCDSLKQPVCVSAASVREVAAVPWKTPSLLWTSSASILMRPASQQARPSVKHLCALTRPRFAVEQEKFVPLSLTSLVHTFAAQMVTTAYHWSAYSAITDIIDLQGRGLSPSCKHLNSRLWHLWHFVTLNIVTVSWAEWLLHTTTSAAATHRLIQSSPQLQKLLATFWRLLVTLAGCSLPARFMYMQLTQLT